MGVNVLPGAKRRTAATNGAWDRLTRELDAWAKAGRSATFWWRDDDAVADTPDLRRMLALSRTYRTPLAVAVIPAKAEPGLFAALKNRRGVRVLQHGYSHANHAGPGAKKCELGAERPRDAVLAELARGRDLLRAARPGNLLPVLVPPWNRIAPAVAAAVPKLGFTGLSTAQPRKQRRDAAGLIRVNSHIDPVDWSDRNRRGFVGERTAVAAAVKHLSAKRLGKADPDEPTGLLTHHLVQDEACWRFLEAFLTTTTRHRATRWLDAAEAFGPSP